jgi:O-antigen/teichoic acid export membrane protein
MRSQNDGTFVGFSEGQPLVSNLRSERFLVNALWSWFGVGANILTGLFVSPYIIRKLGAEGYGVWALLFSTIGYYALLDFGFRSAVVRYAAHFSAKSDPPKINEIINSAVAYSSAASLILLLTTIYFFHSLYRFFDMPPRYVRDFSLLILMLGATWAMGLIFYAFGGCLEGFQRFDLTNRIAIMVVFIRSLGSVVVLSMGQGLMALGWITTLSQVAGFVLLYVNVRRVFPELRISPRLARWTVLKEMAHFSIHSFLANTAQMILDSTGSLLVGHYLPVAYAGYYNLPVRLLQYTSDAADRVGSVTTAQTAELQARDEMEALKRLGVFTNRYCLVISMPITIMLLVYGKDIFRIWVGAAFAAHSAPLLPILLIGVGIVLVGQANSSPMLFGLAKHRFYSYGLVFEAAANVAVMTVVIPRWGIFGAAWTATGFMVLVRGFYTPWLLCRNMHVPLLSYLGEIYVRPVLTALPVILLTYWCKRQQWGQDLFQIILIGAIVSLVFLAAASITCLEAQHRLVIYYSLLRQVGLRRRATMGASTAG